MLKELSKNCNSMKKDIETIKRISQKWEYKKLKFKKNTLERINNRLDETEDQISIWKIRQQKFTKQSN